MVDALMQEIELWEKEEAAKGTLKTGSPSVVAAATETKAEEDNGGPRVRLPVLS